MTPLSQPFQASLCISFSYLLGDQQTRLYVDPGSISALIEPFTNTYGEVTKARWAAASSSLLLLLRSWAGLLCFTNDVFALKSLVQAMQLPSLELQVSPNVLRLELVLIIKQERCSFFVLPHLPISHPLRAKGSFPQFSYL